MISTWVLDKRGRRFLRRLLDSKDSKHISALRRKVIDALPDPDLYVPEPDEESFLHLHQGKHGRTLGIFDQEELIAYGAVGFPSNSFPDNLDHYLEIPTNRFADYALIASCMVLPSHRGLGLQSALLEARFALALEAERHYAVAMVSPGNHPSRHNMLAQGMRIRWLGEIDHIATTRHLLITHIPTRLESAPQSDHRLHMEATDHTTQIAAIKAGWQGWRDYLQHDRTWIEFARFGN